MALLFTVLFRSFLLIIIFISALIPARYIFTALISIGLAIIYGLKVRIILESEIRSMVIYILIFYFFKLDRKFALPIKFFITGQFERGHCRHGKNNSRTF